MFSYRESKNKIYVSASNITDNKVCIDQLFSYGVGGIITKTISLHPQRKGKERIWTEGKDLYNTTRFSKRSFLEWEELLRAYLEKGLVIIPNICPESVRELDYMVKSLENLGVPAIELGMSCPNTDNVPLTEIWKDIELLVSLIHVPLYLKLCARKNVVELVKRADEAGIKGVILSDSFPETIIRNSNAIRAGHSGDSIRPFVLQQIHTVRKAGITCEIVGTGGILTKTHVREYLLAGADAVGICSSMYLFGMQHIKTLLEEGDGTDEKAEHV